MCDSLPDRAAGDPVSLAGSSSSPSATRLTIDIWSEPLPDVALLYRVDLSSQLL